MLYLDMRYFKSLYSIFKVQTKTLRSHFSVHVHASQEHSSMSNSFINVHPGTWAVVPNFILIVQLDIGNFTVYFLLKCSSTDWHSHHSSCFHYSGQGGNNYAFCYFNVLSGRGTFRFQAPHYTRKARNIYKLFYSNVPNRMYNFFGFQLLHCSSNECSNETWSTFIVLSNRGTLKVLVSSLFK
jgi:hypothetical protein